MTKKRKKRSGVQFKNSLRKRMVIYVSIFLTVFGIAVAAVSYFGLMSAYQRAYNETVQDLLETLARDIEADEIEKYLSTGKIDDYYMYMKYELDDVKESYEDIQYLYMYYPYEDHLIYIVEGARTGDDPAMISQLGERYDYISNLSQIMYMDFLNGRSSQGLVTGNAGMGQGIFNWAPIKDSSGKVVAMIEADCIPGEMYPVVNSFALPIVVMQVALVLLMALLVSIGLRREVTGPLDQVVDLVDSYDEGHLDEELLKFPHDDEMNYMATSFKEMTVRMEEYIKNLTAVTAEKERISAELDVATQIQADMLPRIFPPFPDRREFDIYASMDPAKEVGGDFYDYFFLDPDHLALVMADVSGKGVPAALFMVISKTLLKNRAQLGGSPKEVLEDINNQLCEGNDAGLFVTVWLGILTISTGQLVSANAGHEYPAIYRKGEGYSLLKDKHGPPLATMEGLHYRETEIHLEHGDAIFLYTDGVTEATNKDDKLFGDERLVESLNQYQESDVEETLVGVRKDIDAFVAEAPQFDDLTMMCVRFH